MFVVVEIISERILLSNNHMAEISEQPKAGVKRNKKLSTRVDLTPMVDLGFLLITFFIFTTTMTQPTAMKLIMPKDAEPMPIRESESMTVLLGGGNFIYYYTGMLAENGSNISRVSFAEFRDMLIARKRDFPDKRLMVIIKPQNLSVYKNTVDALDEMTINDVKSYAIMDVTEAENKLIEQKWAVQ